MVAKPTTSAVDVARYLVLLAANGEEPDVLTPLRLQKLLYYVQGWHLAQQGGAMFREDMEAWANGPVVREVWRIFQGNRAIDGDEGDSANLTDADRDFIERVWEAYRCYSAWSLREMTHNEKPWKNARKGCGPTDRCDRVIDLDDVREHFAKLARTK